MKQFTGFAAVFLLTLSGCNQAGPDTRTETKDNPNNPPAAKADGAVQKPAAYTPETRSLVSSQEVPLLEQINRENVKVVGAAAPSIVRITATGPVDSGVQMFHDLPFQFHFGPVPRDFRSDEPSYGSGVIISKDGYIVTNSHVLEGARTVEVQLPDQRTFPARMVASDSPMDVAVLKIEAADLPALPWGDSDKVQVGEQVFAIGNPFNLDDSVSKGIVSAKGRNLPDSNSYEDYIQTDAAINPGNSGGALINIHGELIGINAAIASISRGNMGVGFAIPSNLVRYAVEGLLKEGKLVRGYLGVRLPTSIDEGVTEQLGLSTDQGALLAGVQRGSPADLAKLRPVDFITEVDGHKIGGVAQLRLIVAQMPIGKEVTVKYIRAGKPQSTTVKIAEMPATLEQVSSPLLPPQNSGDSSISGGAFPHVDNVLDGLQVTDLNDKTRKKFGIDGVVTSGVVITGVEEGSPSDARGLERGDVIEVACPHRASIQPLVNAGDFTALTKDLKANQGVALLVFHGGSGGFGEKASLFIYLSPQPK